MNVFRLRDRGLERVLGRLEAMIMKIMWGASGPVTIRDVTDRLCTRQALAFNTIITGTEASAIT